MEFFISSAYAQQGAPQGSLLDLWPLVVIFIAFYFLLIRPQQKKQKEHGQMVAGLQVGDEVMTAGGILGRITGISGIFAGAITGEKQSLFRWAFLLGLIAGPVAWHSLSSATVPLPSTAGGLHTVLAGLLVGFGTRYAGGCTSGHGVCGIGRLSPRSIAATGAFMVAGMVTVFITRHGFG